MATKLGGSFHAQTSVQRDKRFILLMEPMNTENRDEIEAVLSLVTRPRVLRLKKGVHLPEETYEGDWKIGERFISSRCGTSPQPRPPPTAVAAGGRARDWRGRCRFRQYLPLPCGSGRRTPVRRKNPTAFSSPWNIRFLGSFTVLFLASLRSGRASSFAFGEAGGPWQRQLGPGRTTSTCSCMDVWAIIDWANVIFYYFPCLLIVDSNFTFISTKRAHL